jgi:tetratricopeptide (TPR) repeat protein
VLDLLTSLVDKSLVVVDESQGATRYRFLETVRQYAAERLAESGVGDTIRERHRDHFLALAEQAEPLMKGPKQAEWLERLETEHDNLRAALRWCAGRPDGAQAGLRLSGALAWFWFIRGHWSEGRAALETALSGSGAQGASPERARALNGAGSMALKLCDYPAARRFHEECLAVRTELGDRRGVGASYGNLGIVAEEQADYPVARANYERCLAICREVGDRFNTAQTLCALGQVAGALGDYREARAFFEESLALSREAEDRFGICGACGGMGSLSLDQGEYARAQALLEECLALSRELGLKRGVAYSLTGLGNVALRQNDFVLARTLLEEGLSHFVELGAKNGVADALEGLALLSAAQADGVRAARLWGAAEALRESLRAPLAHAARAQRDRDVGAARSATGEAAFLAAWAEGRATPLEQTLSSIYL